MCARSQVGVFHPPFAGRGGGLRLIGVAGTDHGGIDKFIEALARREQFGVLHLDFDLVARQQVGDVHLKHIGALLLQQGGAAAFHFGLLVVGARLLPLFNLGDDGALADGHLHAVDGGAGRRGEDVDGFQRFLAVVLIDLGDLDVGDHPSDVDLGAGVFQGELIDLRIRGGDQEVGREGLVVVGFADFAGLDL